MLENGPSLSNKFNQSRIDLSLATQVESYAYQFCVHFQSFLKQQNIVLKGSPLCNSFHA